MPTALRKLFGVKKGSRESLRGVQILRILQALMHQPSAQRRYRLATRLLRQGPFSLAIVVRARMAPAGNLSYGLEAAATDSLDLDRVSESLRSRLSPLMGMPDSQSRWMALHEDPFGPGCGFLRKFGLACGLVLPLGPVGQDGDERDYLLLAAPSRLEVSDPPVSEVLAVWSLYRGILGSTWPGSGQRPVPAEPLRWPGSVAWDLAPCALALVRNEEVVLANEAAEKLLKSSVGADGQSWRLWLAASVRRLESQGGQKAVLIASRSRKRSLEVAIGSLLPGAGGRIVAIRDATAEVMADTHRAETISTLSHELRTPLTSMKNSVGLILRGDAGQLSGGQKRFLALAMRNIDRLDRLINDLLDVSCAEAGQLSLRRQMVDLGVLLREALDMLAATARQKQVQLDYSGLPASFTAHVDGDKVVQMVLNTAGNALKFTEQGGMVRLWLDERNCELPALTARVADHFFLPLKTFTLVVEDNGMGMSEEVLANLFDPFHRGRAAQAARLPGSGLGLHITRGLVEAHGGAINLSSTPDMGTTVWIMLPRDLESERVLVAVRKLGLAWNATEDQVKLAFLDARRPDLESAEGAWQEAAGAVHAFLQRVHAGGPAPGEPGGRQAAVVGEAKPETQIEVAELTPGLWGAPVSAWSRLEAAWEVEQVKPGCPPVLLGTRWEIWNRPQDWNEQTTSAVLASEKTPHPGAKAQTTERKSHAEDHQDPGRG